MNKKILPILLCLLIILSSCSSKVNEVIDNPSIPAAAQHSYATEAPVSQSAQPAFDINSIPPYSGTAHITINNNIPSFQDEELSTEPFEKYSPLDGLGRCGIAYANICKELMPTEKRQGIGQIKPAGWHTVRYDVVGAGSEGYLYNRCHLIGFQLAGENANERNLITGTRYLNIQGMLPFENKTAEYIKSTNNHVLYRVTPIYDGDNLLCAGLQIEAKSVEDNGNGLSFNIFCYNVQPGVIIDYATGDSRLETPADTQAENEPHENTAENASPEAVTYILNKNTKKFHYPYCSSVDDMKETNKLEFTGSRDYVINQGYVPCQRCNP